MASDWNAEMDQTMERIWQSIADTNAETNGGLDELNAKPRERHLRLVAPLEEDDD